MVVFHLAVLSVAGKDNLKQQRARLCRYPRPNIGKITLVAVEECGIWPAAR